MNARQIHKHIFEAQMPNTSWHEQRIWCRWATRGRRPPLCPTVLSQDLAPRPPWNCVTIFSQTTVSSHRPDCLEVEGTARASHSCRSVSSPGVPGRCRGRRQGLSQGRSADPWWRHQGSCGPHRGGRSSQGSGGGEQPSLPAMSQGGSLAKMRISDHSSKTVRVKRKSCENILLTHLNPLYVARLWRSIKGEGDHPLTSWK